MSKAILFAVFTMIAAPSLAEQLPFEFDKSHADITFRVSHLGYSSTHGRFNEFDGSFSMDPDNLSDSSVTVVIKTDSVETSWPKRNEHLKSSDFFNVEQFPEMKFTSTALEMKNETLGTLTGELTLLNATHPISLEVTINKIAPHPRSGKLVGGFTAIGTLTRSQWGMSKFVPGIADEIEIRLDMEVVAIES